VRVGLENHRLRAYNARVFPVRPADTDEATWRRWIARWSAMSPADKARKIVDSNATVRAAALAGIRQRHPEATEREQQMYLAAQRMGDELAKAAFGWDPAVRGR
jgi:hypothetical protein